jgi:hypothetical protein
MTAGGREAQNQEKKVTSFHPEGMVSKFMVSKSGTTKPLMPRLVL